MKILEIYRDKESGIITNVHCEIIPDSSNIDDSVKEYNNNEENERTVKVIPLNDKMFEGLEFLQKDTRTSREYLLDLVKELKDEVTSIAEGLDMCIDEIKKRLDKENKFE